MNSIKTRISKLNELITNDKIKVNTNGDTNFRIFDYDPTDRYIVNNYLYVDFLFKPYKNPQIFSN